MHLSKFVVLEHTQKDLFVVHWGLVFSFFFLRGNWRNRKLTFIIDGSNVLSQCTCPLSGHTEAEVWHYFQAALKMQNMTCAEHHHCCWTTTGCSGQMLGNEEGKQKPKCSIFPSAKDKLQLIRDFGMKRNLKHVCSLTANIYANKENSYQDTPRTEKQPVLYLLMDYNSIRHNK